MEIPEELPDIEAVLEKAVRDPTLLNSVERALLYRTLSDPSYRLPEAIEFTQPFEQSFAYGGELLNLKHPVTQALLRFVAAFELSKRCRTLPKDRLGHLEDALAFVSRVFSLSLRYGDAGETLWEQLPDTLRRLWSLAREVQLFEVGEIEDLVPTPEEFVPGTVGKEASKLERKLAKLESIRPFGQPLT